MTPSGKHPALDYEQRGDLCPVQTPIQIEELADRTRFIDPPNIRNVLQSLVWAFLLLVVGTAMFVALKPWHLGATALGPWWPKRAFGALISLLFISAAAGLGRMAARCAKYPTIIEIGPERFSMTWPSQRCASYPAEQISGIALDTSLPFLPDGKWLNSLRIQFVDRGYFNILPARPRAEIKWLATQLLIRLPKRSFSKVDALDYSGTYRNRAKKVRVAAGSDPPSFVEVRTDGTVLVFPKVDFATGARSVLARVASNNGGRIEFRSQSHTSEPFAIIELASGSAAPEWKSVTARIDPKTYLRGELRVFLTFCGDGSPMQIEYFQLQSDGENHGAGT